MCGCYSSLRKTLYSLWKDQTAPFLGHYKTLEVFTAKCRNRPRVGATSETLVDLPLVGHVARRRHLTGHSADSGWYTDPLWSLLYRTRSPRKRFRRPPILSVRRAGASIPWYGNSVVYGTILGCGWSCIRSRHSWTRTSEHLATSSVRTGLIHSPVAVVCDCAAPSILFTVCKRR